MKKRFELRRFVWTLAVIFLLAGLATSFTTSRSFAQAQSFGRVDVTGNQRIEASTIRNFVGLDLKKPVSPGQINAAYQRLIATGLFEEVKVIPRGGSLVVEVREYPTINRINFEGNKRVKDEKLAEVIVSRPRHTYSPAQAEADAALIVEAYRQSGRFTAEVKPKIIRRSDNRVDLAFEIFEGKVVEIQRLSFVGNRHFSDNRLRKVLATKQAGIFRAFVKADAFVADRIAFDRQILTDYYFARGFVDFQVLSVATEVARERDGFFLTFNVREGQQYRVGKVTTVSKIAGVKTDAYHKVGNLRTGTVYSPSLVEVTLDRMEALATKNGLNFVRITPVIVQNDRNLTLDVEMVIEPGPRVFVERIDIEGNDTTLDRVIRREFDTVEGDPFNPRAIRTAAQRIKALGFFETAEVTAREGTTPDQVVVDVNVKDKPTGSLSFGVNYGASGGIGGAVSLSESNFLGRGQFLSVNLTTGTSSGAIGLSFAEPRLLDRNVRFDFDLSQTKSTQQNAFYDTNVQVISSSLTFPLSRNGKLSVGYRYGANTISNVTGVASKIIIKEADAGTRTAGSINFGYTFDNRSSGIRPTSGIIFRLTEELAGFGGVSKYSKTSLLIGARTTTFNEDVSFSAELEGGILTDASGASRITDRFQGSGNIVRGFANNGMGPRDMAVTNMDALGGNMYAVARFEATFPVGLPEEYGVAGGLFFDIGSVWSLNATTLALAPGTDAGMHIRSALGVSIFWETAVGPLRFNFTRALSKRSYDQTENFSLSIGKRF
jgi:outer membrane protein insertion porin family